MDLDSWEIVRRFPTDKGPYNVEVTSDGKKLLVSYKSAAAVGIWDLEKGVELANIPSSRRVTHGVVISPDARFGFVSSEGVGYPLRLEQYIERIHRHRFAKRDRSTDDPITIAEVDRRPVW